MRSPVVGKLRPRVPPRLPSRVPVEQMTWDGGVGERMRVRGGDWHGSVGRVALVALMPTSGDNGVAVAWE